MFKFVRRTTFAAVFLALLVATAAFAQGPLQEETLGDPVGGGMMVIYNDLAVAPDGTPVVAYSDGGSIYVEQWDGSAWVRLGDAAAPADAMFSRLAVGEDGAVVITYLTTSDDGSTALLNAAQWDGTAWTPLGDAINLYASGTFNYDESLIVMADGPVVAWREASEFMQPDQLYVRQWDGSAWQPLGTDAGLNVDPAADAGVSTLAALPNGRIALAWDEGGMTHVRLWDGSAWTDLPDAPAPMSDTSLLRLTATAEGDLVLLRAGYDLPEAFKLAADVDGDAWMPMDGLDALPGLADAGYVDDAALAVDENGDPLLAWSNGGSGAAGYARWTGSAWEPVGDAISFTPLPVSFIASVALTPDGALDVARLNEMFGLQVTQYTPQS
ncbi:MAG TPA: hypothetical protein PKD09_07295 [Aggregatilinea sp.]|uniref:hypothetical protein n=1 Tax=Aggregatilinea sp. TaxID=2806333 RepID=UPI002C7D7A4D|nr:hypothetical protein [Aggregatilinea sp.]HML21433.1 hypothetical protein [Aggregatilinea sp.]